MGRRGRKNSGGSNISKDRKKRKAPTPPTDYGTLPLKSPLKVNESGPLKSSPKVAENKPSPSQNNAKGRYIFFENFAFICTIDKICIIDWPYRKAIGAEIYSTFTTSHSLCNMHFDLIINIVYDSKASVLEVFEIAQVHYGVM